MMRRAKIITIVTAAAVTLLLAACGNGGGSATSAPTAPSSFNSADVRFAQNMIAHHRGALAMAELADGRASSTAVKDLAARIETAQGPEIDTMQRWLRVWGAPETPEGSSTDMHMAHGPDAMSGQASGMMSEADMAKLQAASGAEFDRLFLTYMITHHKGAVAMAETERNEGKNPDAQTLAATIITTQQGEIAEMQLLLERK